MILFVFVVSDFWWCCFVCLVVLLLGFRFGCFCVFFRFLGLVSCGVCYCVLLVWQFVLVVVWRKGLGWVVV